MSRVLIVTIAGILVLPQGSLFPVTSCQRIHEIHLFTRASKSIFKKVYDWMFNTRCRIPKIHIHCVYIKYIHQSLLRNSLPFYRPLYNMLFAIGWQHIILPSVHRIKVLHIFAFQNSFIKFRWHIRCKYSGLQ